MNLVGTDRQLLSDLKDPHPRDARLHPTKILSWWEQPAFVEARQESEGTSEAALTDQPENEEWVSLSEIEGRYVARVLEHTKGNKQAAARILAVDRKTLDRMIKRHHIDTPHRRRQRTQN